MEDPTTMPMPPMSEDDGPPPSPVPPVIDGYEITGFLGEGGMGRVWRAYDLGTRREVAIKVMSRRGHHRSGSYERFEREVELASRLEHPHIARVYTSGLHGGHYYYVMELIRGTHLDDYVKDQHLSHMQMILLVRKICLAVHYAHSRQVIHRDLKPRNILVTDEGDPSILDFGLATTAVGDEPAPNDADRGVSGTIPYMSPEQAAGQTGEISTLSDVYALGVILYRLLTGRFTHDLSGTATDCLARIAQQRVTPPRQISTGIGWELEMAMLKSLEHDPQQRYASAADLAEDLRRYPDEPLLAGPGTTTYVVGKSLRRNRGKVTVAALLLVLLITGSAWAWMRIVQERDHARALLYANLVKGAERAFLEHQVARSKTLLAQCPADHRDREWIRLQRLVDQSTITFDRHDDPVNTFAASARGRLVASGGMGKTVWLWERTSGHPVTQFDGHRGSIESVAISADETWIASGDSRGFLKTWNADTGAERWSVEAHRENDMPLLVVSTSISGDDARIVTADTSGTRKTWDAQTGMLLDTSPAPAGSGTVMLVDGAPHLALVRDPEPKLIDLATSASVLSLDRHDGPITAIAASADGRLIATGGADETIMIWQVSGGRRPRRLTGHDGRVQALAFHRDGTRLVSGGRDTTIRIWDVASGRLEVTLHGHEKQVSAVAFAPGEDAIISSGADGTVRCWPASAPPGDLNLGGPGMIALALAVHPKGTSVAAACHDQFVRIWDFAPDAVATVVGDLRPSRPLITAVAFSPDGTLLATCDLAHRMKVYRTSDWSEVTDTGAHEHQPVHVTFSPDGQWIVTASQHEDDKVRIWNAQTGRLVRALVGTGPIAISDDQAYLATGLKGDLICMRSTHDWRVVRKWAGHEKTMTSFDFSPIAQTMLTSSIDGTARIWRWSSGEELQRTTPYGGETVASARFSEDGRRFVTAGTQVRLWDCTTGAEVATLGPARHGPYTDVAFVPGARIVAGSPAGVAVWSLRPN
ncbi:MAG: hypothetical protein CMJ18_27405 [Phycisphaeraceae bacterium]|nr:hypothetical protein [Phycisphaeraceae bacterium]